MSLSPVVRQVPEIADLLAQADYADEKIVSGNVSMREFVSRMLSYQPAWLNCLYETRGIFVRMLGLHQVGTPRAAGRVLRPATLSMQPGERASFFTVRAAAEERYWIGEADDKHLAADLAVVVEPIGQTCRRFHLLTIVRYHNWKGPVYFHTIQPFHHLVVASMARAGVSSGS